MYPGPDDPDLGSFVAQLERALRERGHEIELAVLDRRAGGTLRYLALARRARAALRHGAGARRAERRRDPGRRAAHAFGRAARVHGDRRLRVPEARARGPR